MGRPALSSGRGPGSATVLSTLDRFISTALPRIENVAQCIAEKIGAEHREADGDAGEDDEPRRRADIFGGRLRQHAAPGWIRLGHSQPKERQRGFGEYRRAELAVASTISGARVLGRMWRAAMRSSLMPTAFAASTKGSSRNASVLERITRAT